MTKTLGILQINDSHANLFEHGDARYTADGFQVETLGGYPRIMTVVKEKRALHGDELLVLDNGDTLHGSFEAVQSKGEVMIPYLQALGIDAMTFHWDAAYTPKHLKEMEQKLGYPILASNVYRQGTKQLYFQPTVILHKAGLRVGIIGIASNIIQKNMPPEFWEGTDFTDGIEETREQVAKLRQQGVDLIVLLSHLGYPQDIALLQRVEGIQLCLSGHTHNRVRSPQRIGDSYIIQSGALASAVGYLELDVRDGAIRAIRHEYIVLDRSVKQDRSMLAMLREDPILQAYAPQLDEKVGHSRIDLHRASSFYGTMDFLLLDAMRAATGLPIAFSNGWRYGGAIKKGRLTRRDLYTIVPMDPMIRRATLTGQEIWHCWRTTSSPPSLLNPSVRWAVHQAHERAEDLLKLENPYGRACSASSWAPIRWTSTRITRSPT